MSKINSRHGLALKIYIYVDVMQTVYIRAKWAMHINYIGMVIHHLACGKHILSDEYT
jgi:hypothetical protein